MGERVVAAVAAVLIALVIGCTVAYVAHPRDMNCQMVGSECDGK